MKPLPATNYADLSPWESIMIELRDSSPRAEYAKKIAGAQLTSADEDGGAFVEVATAANAEWWQSHMPFAIRRKLLSHGIRVAYVTIQATATATATAVQGHG